MKKLKELADKNNAEILDKEFLENTLYPIVDANKAKRKRKLIPATATVICCVLLFSIGNRNRDNIQQKLCRKLCDGKIRY